MNGFTWFGIAFCVLQSGAFSGLNLAVFGVSAMQLQARAATGDERAAHLLALRKDSNFLLSTILWGNVGTNVLLTLLTDSVLAGAIGFVFSTVLITLCGEILPQAYFSRHAVRMVSLLHPFLRLWQIVLFPIAKPTALVLDAWLGREGLQYVREKELREILKRYTQSADSEISRVEGIGAMNFLSMDDRKVSEEGSLIAPDRILALPEKDGFPVFPEFTPTPEDPFLRRILESGQRWVVVTSPEGDPLIAVDSDELLRDVFHARELAEFLHYCHRPIVVRDPETTLEQILPRLNVEQTRTRMDDIDQDLILYWGDEKRIITGADLLVFLMRGIHRLQPNV